MQLEMIRYDCKDIILAPLMAVNREIVKQTILFMPH